MTVFWLTVRTGISDLELVFDSHSSPPLMSESVLIWLLNSMDSIPADKSAVEDATGPAKTFPDIPCVSQMLGGPFLRVGIPIERLCIPPGTG